MTRDIAIRIDDLGNLHVFGELAGVVVFAFPNESPSLAVERAWEPHNAPPLTTTVEQFADGISPTAEPVEIEDLVAACPGDAELRGLWLFVAQTFHAGIQVLLGQQNFVGMRELVDYVEKVAEAIEARLAP